MHITLIFPDQLFAKHPALEKNRPVYLAEEFLFFRVQHFHKQRLVLLRGAMRAYQEYLIKRGFEVHYLESSLLKKRGDLFHLLGKKKIKAIYLATFADDWLREDLEKGAKKYEWALHYYDSPMFLCTQEQVYSFFKGKKRFLMAPFYAYQRKRLNLLMKDGHPLGGKLSFDQENRKKIPPKLTLPKRPVPKQSAKMKKIIASIEAEFPDGIGEIEPFLYPVTFQEAKKALNDFIEGRFSLFGEYEDAIIEEESFLFHSVLSPILNIGLITPEEVVEAAMAKKGIPLNSLEGFLRQIIGWREFMRACYLLRGRKQRSSNFFKHKHKIPKGFWDGTTGIRPLDSTIQKVLKTGYCHHIERLMILGNFLLLSETDPDEVYYWFMGYFVDAYDWVMVPNIYGMSQYADQGSITTKPYISSANYIVKMSNYPKESWVDIWDGLFWRFISKHKILFQKNPRTKAILSLFKKNTEKIESKIKIGEKYLHS